MPKIKCVHAELTSLSELVCSSSTNTKSRTSKLKCLPKKTGFVEFLNTTLQDLKILLYFFFPSVAERRTGFAPRFRQMGPVELMYQPTLHQEQKVAYFKKDDLYAMYFGPNGNKVLLTGISKSSLTGSRNYTIGHTMFANKNILCLKNIYTPFIQYEKLNRNLRITHAHWMWRSTTLNRCERYLLPHFNPLTFTCQFPDILDQTYCTQASVGMTEMFETNLQWQNVSANDTPRLGISEC